MEPLYDVSFAGSKISIDGYHITEFVDDANPIEFQDTTLCTTDFSCNGRMMRCMKPSPIVMSVTVIPGGVDDSHLHDLFVAYYNKEVSVCDHFLEGLIFIANETCKVNEIRLKGGTMISGVAGISSSFSGKMKGSTYTFAWQEIK